MSLISTPQIESWSARPYAAIRTSLAPADMSAKLPPLTDEVHAWLAARGESPDGPELWRYLVIDMSAQLTVEVGFPVARLLPGDEKVVTGALPEGLYAVTTYRGHPQGLSQATGELLRWGDEAGVTWDRHPEGAGEAWASRTEWYLSTDNPDPAGWETELAFKLWAEPSDGAPAGT